MSSASVRALVAAHRMSSAGWGKETVNTFLPAGFSPFPRPQIVLLDLIESRNGINQVRRVEGQGGSEGDLHLVLLGDYERN